MSAHKRAKLEEHSGFVHAILQVMSNTAKASGQKDSDKISSAIQGMSSADANRVAESRFTLGANDGSYLRQSVMPLQTASFDSCDNEYSIGPSHDNISMFEDAGQAAVLSAMKEDINSNLDTTLNELKKELEVAGWILTIPEVYAFVERSLQGNAVALQLVRSFSSGQDHATALYSLVNFKTDGAQAVLGIQARMEILVAIALIFGTPAKHMQDQMYTVVNKTVGEVMTSIDSLALASKFSKAVYDNDTAKINRYEGLSDQFYSDYIPMQDRNQARPAEIGAPFGTGVRTLGQKLWNLMSGGQFINSETPTAPPRPAPQQAPQPTPQPQVQPRPEPPPASRDSSSASLRTAMSNSTLLEQQEKISTMEDLFKSKLSMCDNPFSIASRLEDDVLSEATSDALKAAFARLREDATFYLSNNGTIQRISGVSPFWNSKDNLLILRYGNEVDYWRARIWNRTLTSSQPPEWLREIDQVESKLKAGAEDSMVARTILNKGVSPFPTYCALRGLGGYRPPHHRADLYAQKDDVLKYSVPKSRFPAHSQERLNVSPPLSSEESHQRSFLFGDADAGVASDIFALKPDAYQAKLSGYKSFEETAKVATWTPLYREGMWDQVEQRSSKEATWTNAVSEAAVYEHVIDMFQSRLCTDLESADPKVKNVVLGAIAAAKVAQLDSMKTAFTLLRNDESIAKTTDALRREEKASNIARIFLTRPVSLCFDPDVMCYNPSVLYPCDSGFASFLVVNYTKFDGVSNSKYEDERIKIGDLEDKERLTPFLRRLISASKSPVGKVPLYIANPPTLEGISTDDIKAVLNSKHVLRTDVLPNVFPELVGMNSMQYTTRSARLGIKQCKKLISLLREKQRVEEYETRPAASTRSDELARTRRNIVWNDALREACIANDRLFAFVRQLSGTVNEQLDSVCMIDEGMLVQQQNKMREKRNRISERAAQEHINLVKSVFSSVLKESGLTLGIDDASRSNNGGNIGELKVVSNTLRKQISDLASGNGQDGFFGNSVRMEQLLSVGTGEMTLTDLFSKLQSVGKAFQEAIDESTINDIPSNSASIDFISAPRNSMMLRYKPEALAAIKYAFEIFQKEFAVRAGIMYVPITAYELIEGNNDTMTTHFASFCGHMMAHSRMFGSSTAMYIGQWPSAANAQQLRLSLNRLVSAAITYRRLNGRPDFLSPNGRDRYFASAPSRYAQMFA